MQSIGLFLAESPWGAIDEEAMGKGLGGRETALVHLAVEWAKLGYDVYAFVPRDDSGIRRVDNLRFIPNGYVVEMTVALDIDLFISWENTEVLAELRDAGYQGTTAIEMQVAGGEMKVLKAGDTYYEKPTDTHTVSRNASKTEPAKFLVVFVKEKDAPVLVPADTAAH